MLLLDITRDNSHQDLSGSDQNNSSQQVVDRDYQIVTSIEDKIGKDVQFQSN